KPADASGGVKVLIAGKLVGTYTPTGHLIAYGQAGGDTLQVTTASVGGVTTRVAVPALLFGGDGGDKLDLGGSLLPNAAVGGNGNDTLLGDGGRDLLIGGAGADQLRGRGGDDIVIGGTTDHDDTIPALAALLAEWGHTDADYPTRLHHLDGSTAGGLNGSYLLTAATVHD